MEISICERFNMNPFQLNKELSYDVMILIKDLLDYQDRQEEKESISKDGTQVIYKPAGDNWF